MLGDAEVLATAFLTAEARHRATLEADSGFSDPYAERFSLMCPPSIRRVMGGTYGSKILISRTKLLDESLLRIVGLCEIGTLLNLGAGFDARPYRLKLPPGIEVVEVDSERILELKERLLPSKDSPVSVRRECSDLRNFAEVERVVASLKPSALVLVLSEGVLIYLAEQEVFSLARVLATVKSGSRWICDVVSVASARLLESAARTSGVGLRMHGLRDLGALETSGWQCLAYQLLPTGILGTSVGAAGARESVLSKVTDGVGDFALGRPRES